MMTHKVLPLFFFVCLLASCTTSRYSAPKRGYSTPKREYTRYTKERDSEKIINYARQQLGTPYVYGGTTPNGFDCSGFVQYVFRKAGYSLPRTSMEQSKIGKKVRKQDLRQGDLVFFKGRNKKHSKVAHVGIVVEKYRNNSFRFIHSASRGVGESNSRETYWKERYLHARRILPIY